MRYLHPDTLLITDTTHYHPHCAHVVHLSVEQQLNIYRALISIITISKGKGKGKVAVTQRIWDCISYDTNDVPIGHSIEWFGATQQSEPMKSKYTLQFI